MRTINRRTRSGVVLGAGGAVIAVLLAACGGGSSGGESSPSLDPNADLSKQSIVVSNWDAYMAVSYTHLTLPTKA